MERGQARTRWTRWALVAGTTLVLAAVDPSWLRSALIVLFLGGAFTFTDGRPCWSYTYQHCQAFQQRLGDRPLWPGIRRLTPMVLQNGAVLPALFGPLRDKPRLQAVALVVGLAGLADGANLADETEAWLIAQRRARASGQW